MTAQVPSGAGNVGDKDWMTTLILAILLGVYGIHQFYVGNSKKGVYMILVTLVTCGIGGVIWTIMDIIAIVQGTVVDGNGKLLLKK